MTVVAVIVNSEKLEMPIADEISVEQRRRKSVLPPCPILARYGNGGVPDSSWTLVPKRKARSGSLTMGLFVSCLEPASLKMALRMIHALLQDEKV